MRLAIVFIFLLVSCSTFRLASPDFAASRYEEIADAIESLDSEELFDLIDEIEGYSVDGHKTTRLIKFKNKRLQIRKIEDKHLTVRMALGLQQCILKNRTKEKVATCLNGMVHDGKIPSYTDYRITNQENASLVVADYLIWICGKRKFVTNMDGVVEHKWLPVEADFLLNTGITDYWITLKNFRTTELCKEI